MIASVEIDNVLYDLDHAHFRGNLSSVCWDFI